VSFPTTGYPVGEESCVEAMKYSIKIRLHSILEHMVIVSLIVHYTIKSISSLFFINVFVFQIKSINNIVFFIYFYNTLIIIILTLLIFNTTKAMFTCRGINRSYPYIYLKIVVFIWCV